MDISAPDTVTGSGLVFVPTTLLNAPGAFSADAFDGNAFDVNQDALSVFSSLSMTRAGLVFTPTTQVD